MTPDRSSLKARSTSPLRCPNYPEMGDSALLTSYFDMYFDRGVFTCESSVSGNSHAPVRLPAVKAGRCAAATPREYTARDTGRYAFSRKPCESSSPKPSVARLCGTGNTAWGGIARFRVSCVFPASMYPRQIRAGTEVIFDSSNNKQPTTTTPSSPPTPLRGEMRIAPHVIVSNAYSSPTLTPPWNTVAPGRAGVAFASRRHFLRVEGTLPEVLNLNRVRACGDRRVETKSRRVVAVVVGGGGNC